MANIYEHLSDSERRRIGRLRNSGWSVRQIGKALGRSVSTVSDEIKRNSVKGTYDPHRAAHKAYVRRKYSKVQGLKVVQARGLRPFVEEKLQAEWSPEMIAGRIRLVETTLPPVSTKAIYKFVASVQGRPFEHCLHRRRVHRKGGPKRGRKAVLDGRVSIEQRPKHVEERQEFGHFEGDFIESGKDGSGSLLVLVERKTRYPFLAYCGDRTTKTVNELAVRLLSGVPVASLTLDNDLSFQKHEELSRLLGTTIFFCHPYCSHEKGTVENRNGRIREKIPKRTDLSQVPEEVIRAVETKLRSLPMKCLNWQTPQESWDEEMKKATEGGGGILEVERLKAKAECSA